jgi:multiple sugar transport system permease protein
MSVTSTEAAAEAAKAKKRKEPEDEGDSRLDPGAPRRAWLLIAPTVAMLTIVVIYPVLRAFYMSLQADETLDPTTGLFVKGGFAGVDNYKHWLLQDCGGTACPTGNLAASFWNVFFITFMFTVVTVILETGLGLWFATIMNKKFKGRALLRASVLVPWAIPTAVTAKLWLFIFSYAGVANAVLNTNIVWTSGAWSSRWAIIIADVWKTTPFMALLILAGLQLIPEETYEAARVDGASPWQRFTHITLPLVKPALMVAVLFRVLDVLRMFDLPWVMTHGGGGTGHATTTLSILVVQQITAGFNSAAALSTITFLTVFIVAFIFVKFFGANVVRTQESQRRR